MYDTLIATAAIPSIATATSPKTLKTFMSIFDISNQTADRIFNIANTVLIFGAALVLFGTIAAVWSGSIRERYSDLRISINERETANANAQAKVASAEVSAAKVEIAKSNERAAALEYETAQAKTEQERLKQIVAWRTLTQEVADQLTQILSGHPALVSLEYTAGDPEALGLAIQFSKILGAAKWQFVSSAQTFSSQLVFAIRLPGPDSDTVRLLRDSFNKVGIPFSTEEIPAPTMSFVQSGPEKPKATIFIGSKHPPF